MLLNIYLKEIKDCFRDRRTLLLTVFLPIIMMSGLTLFYEKLSSDGADDSLTLAVSSTILAEEENIFAVYENIELMKTADPEAVVQAGEAQAALLLTEGFASKVQAGEAATATIVGDSFSQNSANLISLVTDALNIYEKAVIDTRLQESGVDSNLVHPFTVEQRELSEENSMIQILGLLLPMILVVAIGVGASPAAADLFAGEKERKTMEALLMTPVRRSTLLVSKWLTITTIGAVTGLITLLVVVLEITFLTENLKQALTFDENIYLIILVAFLITILYAMFNASILMITSIVGKTIKEAGSYASPIMMLSILPMMLLTSTGVNELTMQHFVIPILNLYSLIKELMFGVIDLGHILLVVGSNVACIIVFFIIGRILFLKDKWVMN
ncbi:ABC transporter permease protein NatB [Robertmurraya siralis]|uniref:ABC transporter permease protein NatB n=1 Tax=Robertmurraya siralis TaxID=77777 RepID=A0A920BW51_9BACI|nr:ABC transporter permease [Robertmurraya siralis]GIN64161.1 ABC transporter permease protein NatB [Robertmurraya siralis]